jgi:hypothetical protein
MHNQTQILKWGTDYLESAGYSIAQPPEITLSTPWSAIVRFSTSTGVFYLKQTPASTYLAAEPQIIRTLYEQFHASVPVVVAINDDLHCFLMQDAGKTLREDLKVQFNPELLCQMIKQYTAIQRSTESHLEPFLKLGVPDWRLSKLPTLYEQMLNRRDFLKEEGLSDQELQILHSLSPKLATQCTLLSSYGIPETFGFHDFHDKNVLFDPNTKKMTFVDWGESAISHPFFTLINCLPQAITHHGVKEGDQTYCKLQDACFDNWSGLLSKDQLLEAFVLAKQLKLIYGILGGYECMTNVDLQAYKSFYANRPSPIARNFREYIES